MYTKILMKKEVASGRFDLLDVMRGIFVACIIVNHLDLYPNFFLLFTGRSRLWGSFAEGFFIISGFLIGYIYRNKWRENPKIQSKKILKRSLKLFLWSILLTLLFTFVGNLMPFEFAKSGLWQISDHNILELLWKTISLQYVYGWADFLSYYAIYLALTPAFLYLVVKHGLLLPATISIAVWLYRYDNPYMGVQAMFVMGLVVGFKYDYVQATIKKINPKIISIVSTLILLFFWSTLLLSIVSVFKMNILVSWLRNWGVSEELIGFILKKNAILNLYFYKRTIGLGRLFLSPIWFLAILKMGSDNLKFLARVFGEIFKKFGHSTLKVYILHSLIIFPIPWLCAVFNLNGFIANTTITLLVLAIIYYINEWTKNFKI